MSYSLSCSESLARVRTAASWMRCLPLYYAEADPTTAILQDPRKLNALQQRVHQTKQKLSLQFLQIKEITGEEFSQRAAAATAAAALALPPATAVALVPPPATDRSRSPRRTVARRTPFESMRELAPKLTQSERHAMIAMLVSGLRDNAPAITAQTALIAEKRKAQLQMLEAPWTEWVSILKPSLRK